MNKTIHAAAMCALLLVSTVAAHALTLPATTSGVTATVDANGNYTISASTPAWTFSGSLNTPVSNLASTDGDDHIGKYVEATFDYTAGVPLRGAIRVYRNKPVVLFSYTVRKGGMPIVDFPSFTRFPRNLESFSYYNRTFAPYSFSLRSGASPWAMFDSKGGTLILSPASDFFISKMTGDGVSTLTSGLNGKVDTYPAGFTHRSLLTIGNGIGSTFQTWGQALTGLYGKSTPSNEADTSLKYLGYWTDHYAYYYYMYDHALGYPGTLLDLNRYFQVQGIPVEYFQLDSWWYPKSARKANGDDAGKMNSSEPRRPWNLGGGCLLYQADQDLFPDGLDGFESSLKMPLITHARWIDIGSPYHKTYQISGVAPLDRAYWDSRAKYLANGGVVTYEQDWLDVIYDNSPGLQGTVDQGNIFLGNMSAAMSAAGLTMQYCMPLPLHYLQGAKYDNLTTVRVSDDGFNPERWDKELYASVLAGSLGEWPWTDVYDSNDTGSMLLSVLTAGPVGISDAKGAQNTGNIRQSVRADGRIVKPDRPAVPSDSTFIAESTRPETPMVAWTYTRGGRQTDYVFCERRGASDVSFAPGAMGIRGASFVYNYFTGEGLAVPAGAPFADRIGSTGFDYYEVAPIDAGGIAFLGDINKFVGTGKSRISSLSDTSGTTLTATVLIAPGDGAITLHGYAAARPSATSANGRMGAVDYDPSTGDFTVTVQPATAARTAIVDGDPVYSVDVSIKGSADSNYALSSSVASLILRPGSSESSSIRVAPLSGFTGNVSLSASNLPAAVAASFKPSGDRSIALTLRAGDGAIAGDYNVKVTGIDGGLRHSIKLPLTIFSPASDVRISCGGPAASPFVADSGFDGGSASSGTTDTIDASAVSGVPQSVWRHGRYGDFSYTFPGLTPGATYHTRLDFDEYKMRAAGRRRFDVFINGKRVLHDFDIYASAGGFEKAIAKSFTATANDSGHIVIRLAGSVDHAMLQGVEVTPVN